MNLLNLIGATLLTVSPILNEPKNVIRPDNVIMEKVEYLDHNIIATTYIYEDEAYYFHLNLNDGKAINVDYNISSSFLNDQYLRSLSFEVPSSDTSSSFSFTSDELLTYGNLSLVNEFKILINLIDDSTELSFDFYFEDYEDLEVNGNAYNLSESISSEFLNYYHNQDLDFTYDLKSNNLFTYYMSKYFFLKESSPITDNIFDIVGGTVEEYLNVVVDLFNEVVELFYVNNKLTILGVLLVFTFGIGIVKFGFNFIKSLLRL